VGVKVSDEDSGGMAEVSDGEEYILLEKKIQQTQE
jgi:hypothetical protein